MTLEREMVADLFGLSGTFPRPGWVVLDAAREHRYTGELIFDVTPETRIYFDRGTIYLAERSTDPSLGARLVDGGALNAAQLEHGSMRIGDHEHLGRLFDRVPSVDRQMTILLTEMMNETCVTWLARQQVYAVTSTPYRHHPAGIHRWDPPADAVELRAGDPLPPPASTDAPVEIAPPESLFADVSNDTDVLVHWDQPSWLDDRLTPEDEFAPVDEASAPPPAPVAPAASAAPVDSFLMSDWADRLETDGLPAFGSDPLAPTAKLPPLPVEQADRFELIWPSGEIDEDFGTTSFVDGDDDRDRVGPTARVVRSVSIAPTPDPEPTEIDEAGLWDFESTAPSFGDDEPGESTLPISGESDDTAPTDDVVLSMRRAVASIETGSLSARRRLAESSLDDSSRGTEFNLPGRVATRTESSAWSASRVEPNPTRSVFDEVDPPAPAGPVSAEQPVSNDVPSVVAPAATASVETEPAKDATDVTDDTHATDTADAPRVSALRRLIGGLRRR